MAASVNVAKSVGHYRVIATGAVFFTRKWIIKYITRRIIHTANGKAISRASSHRKSARLTKRFSGKYAPDPQRVSTDARRLGVVTGRSTPGSIGVPGVEILYFALCFLSFPTAVQISLLASSIRRTISNYAQ